MPHASPRRHPPDLGGEAEQEDEPHAVLAAVDTRAAGKPPAEPDDRCREDGVDSGLPLVGDDRPEDPDDRHQGDRRERRERHVEVAVAKDHVLVAEADVQPDTAVQERVREIEEVAPGRVEVLGR